MDKIKKRRELPEEERKKVCCKQFTTAMTPAVQEKAMKSHGVCLSSSLPSREMESSETLAMESTRPVKEKINDDSATSFSCSILGFPASQVNHNIDCFNLKYFDPQSSKHCSLLMSPNLTFSVNNNNCIQKNLEEHNCSKLRNPVCNSTYTHFNQSINSESGVQVRGDVLSGTRKSFLETERLLDLHLTELKNTEEKQFPNYKWYRRNGFCGKALFVNPDTKKGDLFHQIFHDAPEVSINCNPGSKEQELNLRLLQCVNKQQTLLNRAKRSQKHLQILLAKHIVKHCDQQMKCFMKHQLSRMKAFYDTKSLLDGNYEKCTMVKFENTLETSRNKNIWSNLDTAPDEIKVFACSTAELLSQVEESLDSEATCSSSSEDDDEQISKITLPINCRSDWKWLVERAKVGCQWTWLQDQISELEYKIQQLTDLHRQIRASKGMVILEECSVPKDILKKRTQLPDQEALNSIGNSQAFLQRQDVWPEHDFEMSPSSPTLLLRNIEKQSAQLSEIISSLIAPLNLSPTSSSLSSKTCKQNELVNGISLRESENKEEISSSSSCLADQQHLKRRRKEKMKLKTPTVALMSTSARTRPLLSFQRRKSYRMNTGFTLNNQALHQGSTLYNTEEIASSKRSTYDFSTNSSIHKQLMLELDTSFHPVLSFSSDVPLHVHFKTLLKKYEIKGDAFEGAALGLAYKMSPLNVFSQIKAPLQQLSHGYESSCKYQSMAKVSELFSEGRRKRHLSETLSGANDSCEALSFQHEGQESYSNFTAASSVDMLSRSSHSISSQLNSRRRLRSECSYDIDNIVIPMSLIAPSKLEKLQYKEILTPSWRIVSLKPLEKLHEDEEKAEDLSDDVYAVRHSKYEDKEKARWSLWEKCRCPRRNRSYSRNFEEQDASLKEKQANSNLTTYISENTAGITSEAYNSQYLGTSETSGKKLSMTLLWERRAFPLKTEEVEVLIPQRHPVVHQECSDTSVLRDSDHNPYTAFSFLNDNQPQKKSSVSEVEDHHQIYLGKKQT
ncbi:KAT8 regulatory NSL complex subunit 1-like protein isoform X1 [Pantherophis guttatus]|uniref:KAT8 regulatory NSL complex subunit 1-like protein isoform X1 n=2 Tax=Pantherophis guttatus TaxID=94885 RepID=A0ABM3Z6Z8_PANGU|nr:KAT8 regulatory NSL complex subunit 1-like protein isoform X1 [Pantherophis guttatus]XP_060544151.1 KAT8 regulatory NSL complex subunit 1-like protein isoform X1 [Pantherophis guttatus]